MDAATLIASFLTLVGVVVAIFTIRANSKLHRRQMNAELFMKYAERYEQIMSCFPDDAFRARFSMDDELPPTSAQLTLAVLRYLNLTSEEFYLWKTKYIDDDVWKIWEDELIRILQSPLFRREWRDLESEFSSYPEFLVFVERAHSQSVPAAMMLYVPKSEHDSGDVRFVITACDWMEDIRAKKGGRRAGSRIDLRRSLPLPAMSF